LGEVVEAGWAAFPILLKISGQSSFSLKFTRQH